MTNESILLKLHALLVLCMISISTPSWSQGKEHQESYHIKIEKERPGIALVEYDVLVADSLFYMSPIGANQFPSRWAKFVHNVHARSSEGDIIQIDTLEGAKWQMKGQEGKKLTLTYEVHLNHEDYEWSGGIDGAAYQTDWGVFYTGRSIFIMNGDSKKDIKVDFEIPENWKVSSPWASTSKTALEYVVKNQTELSDSMFFAGQHEELVINRDEFELIFAFGGDEIIAEQKSFTDMATGVLDYYIELFGGIPNPSPENKFTRSLVVLNASQKTDGEVIGNHISILLEKNGDEMSQLIGRFIFAHEFFHLWSGKSFAPSGNDCEWFKEGVTNYYTLKSLFHIGYLNEKSFLSILDKFFFNKYINDPGLGQLSMTQGDQKHAHWGLIYGGGFFAGIAQDMILRTSTSNQQSLDVVMKHLFQKYGGTNKNYTLDELQKILSETGGQHQSEFFKKYISGTEILPLADYLNMGGFSAKEENGSISIEIKENRTDMEKQINDGFFGIK